MNMGAQIRGIRENAAQLLYLLNIAFPTWGGLVAALYVLAVSSGSSMALRRMWTS